jgi:hypothetical protein
MLNFHVSLPVVLPLKATPPSFCNVHVEYRLFTVADSTMVSNLTMVAAGYVSVQIFLGSAFPRALVAFEKAVMVGLVTTWFQRVS